LKSGADLAIKRPDEMATDAAPKLPAIRHCLEQATARTGISPEIFVDLDVTSPLRLPSDIAGTVELLRQSGARNVITGAPAHRSPYFNLVEARADGSVGLSKAADPPIVRRQDAPRSYDMNASIYAWRVAAFLENPAVFYPDTRLFEMPQDRSVDIDSDLDFALVELLLRKRLESAEAKP
jgi:N-acylneuraminate cytidylyltransferase/CMP-N,N'-diacetyllegionaminic acid synthase